jgi:ribosomal protein L28
MWIYTSVRLQTKLKCKVAIVPNNHTMKTHEGRKVKIDASALCLRRVKRQLQAPEL